MARNKKTGKQYGKKYIPEKPIIELYWILKQTFAKDIAKLIIEHPNDDMYLPCKNICNHIECHSDVILEPTWYLSVPFFRDTKQNMIQTFDFC